MVKFFFWVCGCVRSVRSQMLFKIVIFKTFAIFIRKHLCWSLFLNFFFFKKTPTQVFPCEYCEVFKNSFFIEHLRSCFYCFKILQGLESEQSPGIPSKSCEESFCVFHRKTPVMAFFYSKN